MPAALEHDKRDFSVDPQAVVIGAHEVVEVKSL